MKVNRHAYNLAFSTCLDAWRNMKRTIRCRVDERDNRETFAQCCATDLNCKRTRRADAGAVREPAENIRFPRWPRQSRRENNRSESARRKQIVDLCEESLHAHCDQPRQIKTLRISGEMKPVFVCFHSNQSITGPVMAALWQGISPPLIPQTRDKVKASEALAPCVKYSVLSPDVERLNLDQFVKTIYEIQTNIFDECKTKTEKPEKKTNKRKLGQITIQPPYLLLRVHCVHYFISLFLHLSN